MANVIDKHIYFHDLHIKVLDDIIKSHTDINNYSEAVRFLCMTYDPDSENKVSTNQAKLNEMSKELSIVTEIISEFADLHLKETGILIGKNSAVYQEAKERVEGNIKVNQTKKYSSMNKEISSTALPDKSDIFNPKNLLKR
ncbi:hypothetical protein ACJQ40_001960 [Enterococcus faecium]|nr:hypothetical protein [Enterococcus faecium]